MTASGTAGERAAHDPTGLAPATLIEHEITALQAVLESLEAEQQALEARDAAALTAASQLKLERIRAAQIKSTERVAQAPDAAALASDPAALARFESLVALARQCKARNEQNGMLISMQRRYLEQTLAVLRNEPAETPLYGPGGDSPRAGRRGSVLGSA
jgi:flagellar biosynthesis/type III secretory pathway chaperone